ncbi:TPR-repeat-containing protein [uncultured Gammaproteobacteria bacterium]|nr:TPR-repeat-containing protein [uncultured Gammaproteobacteria bacterium]
MKKIGLILLLFISGFSTANVEYSGASTIDIKEPMYNPFVERYVLDELKSIRQGQQDLRVELTEKVANTHLDISDRALSYTYETTTNIFYIITISASLLVLLGWRSMQDVKDNIKAETSRKISTIIQEYEQRLDEIEKKLKRRSEQILVTQQDISNTNSVHSLWMRAALEKSDQEKLSIYDEILELKPDDIEALTYKADALLDIDEDKWSLSLSNQAIEIDEEYSMAYWQRACAKAKLGQYDDAIEDIKVAISLRDTLKEEVEGEAYFENLKGNKDFDLLIG